jgi:integral membrane protein
VLVASLLSVLHKIEATRPFTEDEAWLLFRIVALSEAVGWTILISGILIEHFNLPGHAYAVPIAGRIHGTIFIGYFGVILAIYSSLRWSRLKFLSAIVAGVPPYGTLLFEEWAARSRRNQFSRIHFRNIVLHALTR